MDKNKEFDYKIIEQRHAALVAHASRLWRVICINVYNRIMDPNFKPINFDDLDERNG